MPSPVVCGLDSYLAQVLICLIQILSAIVVIRENLWVHIQCICRFAFFSCDGHIRGTWCVSASACLRTSECMRVCVVVVCVCMNLHVFVHVLNIVLVGAFLYSGGSHACPQDTMHMIQSAVPSATADGTADC